MTLTKTDLEVRVHFIKQLEPFSKIDDTLLKQIANHIEEINLSTNDILFRQGDDAECCYLLYSGKVNIVQTRSDGSETSLSELDAGAIIGEMALLTDNKRNATVIALTPCKLLVLKRNEFQQLVQEPGFSDSLTSMLMDRHRPEQCEGITIHTRLDAEQKTIVILKNLETGAYFKTAEQGLFVWNLLDGEHTIQEIAIEFFYKYHLLATDDIGNLILKLMQSGFVKTPKLTLYVKPPTLSLPMRVLTTIAKIMQYEYSIKNVDAFITRLYERAGYLFFTKTAKILMAVFAIAGFCAFVSYSSHTITTLKTIPDAWIFLILLIPASMLTIPLHELAHALTTKAYGRHVHRLGIGWFWFGPIAFADTSDMWLSSRGPRIAVNLAGIYINLVIAGIFSLFALMMPHPKADIILWFFALSNYLLAFYNLDPIFELDGYYVLMDMVDKPNLRFHAVKWLIENSKKTFSSWKMIRHYSAEILYWIMSIVFILVSAFIAYLFQAYIFKIIFPEKTGEMGLSHYRWVLSAIVIFLSFMSLYLEVRRQRIHG